VDQKPPPLLADERATILGMLDYQRGSLVRKVSGIADDDAARPATPTGTSLLWLVQHVRRAEHMWVVQRFAGRPGEAWDDQVRLDRSLTESVDEYRATWSEVDAIIAAQPNLDGPCAALGDLPQRNLRWVLLHVLGEITRHAGHADIIREHLDGQTGR
jgi:Protein of unknown function (DUF664)